MAIAEQKSGFRLFIDKLNSYKVEEDAITVSVIYKTNPSIAAKLSPTTCYCIVRQLMLLGYLKREQRGMYVRLKHIEDTLTSNKLKELAYDDTYDERCKLYDT